MATTPPRPHRQDQDPVPPSTPSSTEKRRLKGLFHGGEWWCNCNPRNKAVERNVQKDTPNRGKRFWACQLPPPDGCGFFLWFEDARLREIVLQSGAVEHVAGLPSASQPKTPSLTQRRLTSCGFRLIESRRRSDPGASGDSVIEPGDEDDDQTAHSDKDNKISDPAKKASSQATKSSSSSTAGRSTATAPLSSFALLTPGPSGASKRNRDVFEDDEFSDMNSDEERQLAAMADKSVEKMIQQRTYNTPNGKRTADDVLTSSSQPVARTLFPRTEPSKRQKTVSFDESLMQPTLSKTSIPKGTQSTAAVTVPSTATSPNTSFSLTSSPQAQSGGDDDDDITKKVMAILRGQRIENSALQSVEQLLLTSARKTKGIALGRDTARATINEKNAKIARLQERILALEDKERFLNSQISNIKANLMKVYQDS